MSDEFATRIDGLELQNFRLFKSLNIDFHPQLTVLTAPNGGGKTAVLEAVALALRPYIDRLDHAAAANVRSRGGFSDRDIHRKLWWGGGTTPVVPVAVSVTGQLRDARASWRVVRTSAKEGARTGFADAKRLIDAAVATRVEFERGGPPAAPFAVVALYGTDRLFGARPPHGNSTLTKGGRLEITPFSAYRDALRASARYGDFEEWYGRFSMQAEREDRTGEPGPYDARQRLGVVDRAVGAQLLGQGWESLSFDEIAWGMTAYNEARGWLPVSWLSDGLRAVIGLVGDLAHRCSRLNPHLGERAALESPGVVLIDEIDMHLHPAWQQTVIGSLRAAFPKIQFIVSTHSPQVLSTVAAESIRILDVDNGEGHAFQPARTPYGHASSVALEAIQGVGAYPPTELLDTLREYQRLVGEDQHDSARALELREQLEQAWGATDPEILRLDVGIRKNEVLRKLGRKGAP